MMTLVWQTGGAMVFPCNFAGCVCTLADAVLLLLLRLDACVCGMCDDVEVSERRLRASFPG